MARDKRGRFERGTSGNPQGRAVRADEEALAQARADGFLNAVTGMGYSSRDRDAYTDFELDIVTPDQAAQLWRGNAIAARIVEAEPDEAFRTGYDIVLAKPEAAAGFEALQTGIASSMAALLGVQLANMRTDAAPPADPAVIEASIEKAARTLNVDAVVRRALQFERGFGGAAILLGVVDYAKDMAQPLDTARVKKLSWLRAVDCRRLTPATWYTNVWDEKFNLPRTYYLTSSSRGGAGAFVEIHESRLIIFPGHRVSDEPQDTGDGGWGDSVFTRIGRSLRARGTGLQGAARLVSEFSQSVYKIKGLAQKIAMGGDRALLNRMIQVELGRSMFNAVMVDAEEDFTRQGAPVSGLADVMRQLDQSLAADVGFPMTVLFGISPGGLNATGESDMRLWHGKVGSYQRSHIEPRLREVYDLILWTEYGVAKGAIDYEIKFRPLHEETESERLDSRTKQMQIDQGYTGMGVITPEQVAIQRFGGTEFSYETRVDPKEIMAQQQAAAMAPPPQPPPPPPQPRADEFDESKIERAPDGKFAPKGGGGAGSGGKPKAEKVTKAPSARAASRRAYQAAVKDGRPVPPRYDAKGNPKGEAPPGYVRLYRGGGAGEFSNSEDGTHGRWFTTSYDTAASYAGTDDTGMLKKDATIIAVDVPREKLPEFAEESTSGAARQFDYEDGLDDLIENGGNLPSGEGLEFYVDEESALAADYYDGDRSKVAEVKPEAGATVESAREARDVQTARDGLTSAMATAKLFGGTKIAVNPRHAAALQTFIDAGSAQIKAVSMIEWAKRKGGFTFDDHVEKFRTQGFTVAKYPERERVFSGRLVTGDEILKYVEDNADVLTTDPAACIGGWLDGETGNFVLDVSAAFDSREDALAMARTGKQAAIWDLDKAELIEVDREAATQRWAGGEGRPTHDSVPAPSGPGAHGDPGRDPGDPRRLASGDHGRAGRGGPARSGGGRRAVADDDDQAVRVDYDPDQPRAEDGKWSAGGGASMTPDQAREALGAWTGRYHAATDPSTGKWRDGVSRDERRALTSEHRKLRQIADKPDRERRRSQAEVTAERAVYAKDRARAQRDMILESEEFADAQGAFEEARSNHEDDPSQETEKALASARARVDAMFAKVDAIKVDPAASVGKLPGGKRYSEIPGGTNRWSMNAEQAKWQNDVSALVAAGKIEPDVAEALGWTQGDGHATQDRDGSGFQRLPRVTWHVTTAADAVIKEGLKTRAELGQANGGHGLGGGTDAAVSLAATREAALGIHRGMLEFHDVLNGKISMRTLLEAAKSGDGASRPYLDSVAGVVGKARADEGTVDEIMEHLSGIRYETTIGDKPPRGEGLTWTREESRDVYAEGGTKPIVAGWRGVPDDTEKGRAIPRNALVETYKVTAAAREHAGGPMDPLFFATDYDAFAAKQRDQIRILKTTARASAVGYPLNGQLAEWRVTSGQAIDEIEDDTP